MRLYHYTARHHVDGGSGHPGPGILSRGLLPNVHPYIDASGLVWLTDSAEWTQTWSARDVPVPGFGSCDRTEVRIEVVIPRSARMDLYPWNRVRRYVITDGMRRDLERYGDPEHWFVFNDRIPPAWLRSVESRPAEVTA